MHIPDIIHHIAPADADRWHPLWARCRQSWLQAWPQHEHRLWDDGEDIDRLVRDHYPEHWCMYQEFPAHIMRIDFARLCILHRYGGIYSDMDVFCYRDFRSDICAPVMIMPAPWGDVAVENALMSSEPAHDFWLACMRRARDLWAGSAPEHLRPDWHHSRAQQRMITAVAGPECVASVVCQYPETEVVLFAAEQFNNHGLSWAPDFRTKHVLTGVWGHEASDRLELDRVQSRPDISWRDYMGERFLAEANRFCPVPVTSIDQFDFYHDYTNGGYLRDREVTIERDGADPDAVSGAGASYG